MKHKPTVLYQCQIDMENLMTNKDANLQPTQVYYSSSEDNKIKLKLNPFKHTQKTLVSFCVKVPPLEDK